MSTISPTRLLCPPVVALVLAAAAAAQTPSWSPDWAVAGLGGAVRALADYGGELHAGGEWFAAKNGVIRGIARFDGVDWRPLGTGIDLVNYSYPARTTQVQAMVEWNGVLVIAGTFDRVDGQPMSCVARWDGSSWAPLGGGLALSFDEADVRALAVFNNELYAAGQFDTAGGQPASAIAKWNGASWSPVGSGLRQNGGAEVGYPMAMHVWNGSLVVGGDFDRAGGLVVNNIARWNGTSWSAMGAGSFATVWAFETWNNQLVASGQFQVGPVVAMPGVWNGTTWAVLGSNDLSFPPVSLRAFGGHLWGDAGGVLRRFDGATWTTAGVVAGMFDGQVASHIRTLHVHGSELILGGQFTRAGNAPGALAVASANAVAFDGGSGWRTLGTGQGLDKRIVRLLPWRSGRVAAGQFSEAGGAPAVGLAFHDGDRWRMLARISGGVVWDAAVHQDSIVVSGSFTHVDGQPFTGIARFDGTSWHPFGTLAPPGLYSHGGELFGFGGSALHRWNGTAFVVAAVPPSGGVDALHSHAGVLYAANNDAFNHRVLRWNGSQLQSIGTANDFVQALGSHGSFLIAGGRFTNLGGAPAALIARWNGTAWSSLPAPVSGQAAYSFCELDGDLYAGVSGDPRGMLLRLRNGAWSALGAGVVGVPLLLTADPAVASVFASGDIVEAGGVPSRCAAEWRTQPDWRNRLHGLAGAAGEPRLLGRGAVTAGSTIAVGLEGPANVLAVLALGLSRIDAPLLSGVLVPSPDILFVMAADAQGAALQLLSLSPGTPTGMDVFAQAWVLDATGPQGLTSTNALQCTVR